MFYIWLNLLFFHLQKSRRFLPSIESPPIGDYTLDKKKVCSLKKMTASRRLIDLEFMSTTK